ncbi:MAG: YecA family protein [Pseudomonadota bacterium]
MAPESRLQPLDDAERDELEALLEALPQPLDPLDLSALDGFLIGVLLQPRPIERERWLRHVIDVDGCAPPSGLKLDQLHALVQRRHAELEHALKARQWFDPWVFELEADESDDTPLPSQVVLPWVAGFCAALEAFPALLQIDAQALREPLAVLYAHFDPEDLEDADDLRALIDEVEPPQSVAEAVEDLVRCSLLIADVSRPRPATARRRSRA